MLRSFLRATARWAGILPEPVAYEGEPAPKLFSTDLMPAGAGRAAMRTYTEALKKAPVPREKGKVRAAMDARDCGSTIKDVFADMDSDAALTDALLGWFSGQRFIGYAMASILSQHWLIDKACTMPARDAVRHGYAVNFKGLDEDQAKDDAFVTDLRERVEKLDKDYRIKHQLQDYVRKGRIFGVRLALFRVDLGSQEANDEYYEHPFNPDAVKPKSYRGIRQVDQYWCAPLMDDNSAGDPISDGFYSPTWWMVAGRKIHHSHFAIFRATEVPDNLKPYYQFGGVPVPQRIMERVYAAERVANEAPMLSLAKRLVVWATDLEEAMADPEKFRDHLTQMSSLQNNFGIQAVNTGDTVTMHDTSLADFDAVVMNQYQLVAAGANVPATKLLGTTPKGFQSTGEFETQSYHEELESVQENDLTPFLDRHHEMIHLSDMGGVLPEGVRIVHDWNPVDSPTAKDYAEVNKANAEADATLVNAGILDPVDSRARLRADPNSGHSNIPEEAPEVEAPVVLEPEVPVEPA